MKKLGLIFLILLLQNSKIFSQQNNSAVDFYVKFDNFQSYSIELIKDAIEKSFAKTDDKVISIVQPFKNKRIGNFTSYFRISFLTHDVIALKQKLERTEHITYVEKVVNYQFFHTPNDPKYIISADTMWHLYKVKAAGGWNLSRGSDSVTIAVIDDNVEISHPDLNDNIYTNPLEIANDGIDNDSNGVIDDVHGADISNNMGNPYTADSNYNHGTRVAGLVSATSNNGIGVASTGYSCKILAIKCTNNYQQVTHGIEGMLYAASMPDVQVVNISWGYNAYSQLMQDIIDSAMFYKKNKIVFVAAAGNNSDSSRTYPAALNNVIAVAATDRFDRKSSSSNYGSWLDIAAPGIGIYTTKLKAQYGNKMGFNLISGTSFSAPIVAGTIGLMFAINKNLTFAEISNCLLNSGDVIDTIAYNKNYPMGKRLNIEASMKCICNTNTCWLGKIEIENTSKNASLIYYENQLKVAANATLFLFDMMGRSILNKNCNTSESIDLSCYPKGIYFVQVSSKDYVVSKKIIVE